MSENTNLDVFDLTKPEFENYRLWVLIPDKDGNPGKETIKGFLMQEMSIMGSADWGSPFNVVSDTADAMIGGTTLAVNQLVTLFSNEPTKYAMAQRKLQTRLQTILSWSGSDTPIISIQLLLVAFDSKTDVTEPARKLLKGVYPTSSGLSMLMTAPYSYTPMNPTNKGVSAGTVGQKVMPGTIQVFVGNWLELTNMIIQQVDVTFSKEVIPSGKPLYARINLSIRSAWLWTVDDIDQIFKQPIQQGL